MSILPSPKKISRVELSDINKLMYAIIFSLPENRPVFRKVVSNIKN